MMSPPTNAHLTSRRRKAEMTTTATQMEAITEATFARSFYWNDLVESLYVACAAADGDGVRPPLAAVRFEHRENGDVKITATNSYVIWEETFEAGADPSGPAFDIMLPAKALKKALPSAVKAAKADKQTGFRFTIRDARSTVGNRVVEVGTHLIDATVTEGYPDLAVLWPDFNVDRGVAATTPFLGGPAMKLAGEAAKRFDRSVRFVPHPTDPLKPVAMFVDGRPDARALVMPVRVTS